MQSGSTREPAYRHGHWGPAYVVQGPTSDIGVLRLEPGQSVPNHLHRHCDESFVVLEGTCSLWINGMERYTMTVDEVIRCEPSEMHHLVNDGDVPFRCIFIKSPASPGDTVTVPWVPGEPAPVPPGTA